MFPSELNIMPENICPLFVLSLFCTLIALEILADDSKDSITSVSWYNSSLLWPLLASSASLYLYSHCWICPYVLKKCVFCVEHHFQKYFVIWYNWGIC